MDLGENQEGTCEFTDALLFLSASALCLIFSLFLSSKSSENPI
ncbi:Uncharacterised protein [Chlamydia trachomatis]|nr:Uncharacterised protein [Chlamydia trachomatis]